MMIEGMIDGKPHMFWDGKKWHCHSLLTWDSGKPKRTQYKTVQCCARRPQMAYAFWSLKVALTKFSVRLNYNRSSVQYEDIS